VGNPIGLVLAAGGLTAEQKNLAEQLAASAGPPPEAELKEAKALLRSLIEKSRPNFPRFRSAFFAQHIAFGFCLKAWFYGVVLPSLLAAFIFRGGFLLHVLGLTVMTRDGELASHLRVFCRCLVAWSPVLLIICQRPGLTGGAEPFDLLLLALLATGGIWSLAHPERGLQDRVAGTWLAPR
jgi:hypothetical protein